MLKNQSSPSKELAQATDATGRRQAIWEYIDNFEMASLDELKMRFGQDAGSSILALLSDGFIESRKTKQGVFFAIVREEWEAA